MMETFEMHSSPKTGASLHDVDIDKNLLKNFLESHSSQLGTSGRF